MRFDALKVGELAKRTGLTVRTLHHYDEIGLLKPSQHTAAGHRLYTADDLGRLMRIVSLRQLGFSLDQVGECLDRPGFEPVRVLRMQAERLREQIGLQEKLVQRLDALATQFESAGEVSAEQFLQTIEVTTMIEEYYTPEQLETLRLRREEAMARGVDIVQQGANDWAALTAEITAAMHAGLDPAAPEVQELQQRKQALIDAFTGGDAGIGKGLNRLWKEQGGKLSSQHGYDPNLLEYMGRMCEAGKGAS